MKNSKKLMLMLMYKLKIKPRPKAKVKAGLKMTKLSSLEIPTDPRNRLQRQVQKIFSDGKKKY